MTDDRDYDALAAKLAAAERRERQLLDTTATCRMLLRELNTAKAKLAEVEEDRDDLQIALVSVRKQLERYIGEAEAALPAVYLLGLEDAASRFDEIAQHDQGGIDYSDLVGIPISNREQLVKSVKDAEMDAKYIRALPTPTAAKLMARIHTGEKE